MDSRSLFARCRDLPQRGARREVGRWRTRLSLVALVAWGALVMVACADEKQNGAVSPRDRPDGSSTGDDFGDAGDAGHARDARDDDATIDASAASCNAVSLDGVTAAVVRAVTESAPAPTGGIIEDGTYVATDYVIYGRPANIPAAPWVRSKLVISGGTWESATGWASGDGGAPNPQTLHASTSSTTLSLTKVCPKAQATETYDYTFATDDAGTKHLRYFNGTVEVGAITYEKQ